MSGSRAGLQLLARGKGSLDVALRALEGARPHQVGQLSDDVLLHGVAAPVLQQAIQQSLYESGVYLQGLLKGVERQATAM